MNLEGRVAIVTGGARGLGRAYVERLAGEGATVVVADIDAAEADRVVATAGGNGDALALEVDVTSEASTQAMAERALERFGRIDALVNNAGIYPAQAFTELTLDEWRRVFAVNVEGTFLATRAVIPAMQASRYGRIVNISSSTVWVGTALMSHYVASKAAIVGLTRSLARELAPDGVTVNAISPGLTLTDTVREHLSDAIDIAVGLQAIKRPEEPRDVAGAVAFLVSEESRFITGQTINVDGGQAMH